ncbi:MAG: hypothetical protein ACYDCQ_04605 [Dehalococcoidia bacterium]
MSAGAARGGWPALHIEYPSPRARLQLIVQCFPGLTALAGAGAWFFADVPLDGGARQGLELAIRAGACSADDLAGWLQGTLGSGLVTRVTRSSTPLMLQPGLFPAGMIPACYPDLLAIASGRAVALLGSPTVQPVAGAVDIPDAVAVCELAALYVALVPRRSVQAACLHHAAWLEAVAGDGEQPARLAGNIGSWPNRRDEDAGVGYRRHRRRLARYADATAHGLAEGEAVAAERAAVLSTVVGRLAHIQLVRLRGPYFPAALNREAALMRGLANRNRNA